MHIVHVHVRVKPDCIEEFKTATIDNASHSIKEPGIVRFDVVQQADEPTSFILVEIYQSAEDNASHKETEHYLRWRDKVVDMMAEPRKGIRYQNIYPRDSSWR